MESSPADSHLSPFSIHSADLGSEPHSISGRTSRSSSSGIGTDCCPSPSTDHTTTAGPGGNSETLESTGWVRLTVSCFCLFVWLLFVSFHSLISWQFSGSTLVLKITGNSMGIFLILEVVALTILQFKLTILSSFCVNIRLTNRWAQCTSTSSNRPLHQRSLPSLREGELEEEALQGRRAAAFDGGRVWEDDRSTQTSRHVLRRSLGRSFLPCFDQDKSSVPSCVHDCCWQWRESQFQLLSLSDSFRKLTEQLDL